MKPDFTPYHKNHIKQLTVFACGTAAIASFAVWLNWQNKGLVLHPMVIYSHRLPSAFSGFRIAHLSDLHNTEFGKHNKKLLQLLKEQRPDIIAITGDLIDARRTNFDVALYFAKQAIKIAPIYYVTGNHESRIPEYQKLEKGLRNIGVTILRDQSVTLVKNREQVCLIGLDDPGFICPSPGSLQELCDLTSKKLSSIKREQSCFTIALSHRPEFIEAYAEHKLDLVLSGHTHGGQIRIPWLGGVIAPMQGFFPKYDAGLFQNGKTKLIIHRGLGNSLFPLRINNRPEVILVTLKKKTEP